MAKVNWSSQWQYEVKYTLDHDGTEVMYWYGHAHDSFEAEKQAREYDPQFGELVGVKSIGTEAV